ncbi:SDR family oxidoreductase [Rothia sp. AR01]|uniref:SDR family oxidoreductase n=1 Tax=Rothia santali TaxID=2949643 RepID=A0A9X2HCF4_9MICC|nr:SDR family oxidoreductase [Rothia santali]MCP3425157.1 SDR family oxidoreductase [Rothia santali]
MSGLIAVTGGSRGIGAAVVERVAAAGNDVIIGFRSNEDAAHAVAEKVRRTGQQAVVTRVDVTDPQSLDKFFEAGAALGPITGLVASAGAVKAVGPLTELDPETIKHDLEVNLLGAVLTARAAIPHLTVSGGSMVLIGSAAATIGSPGAYVHYAAAKAGTAALTIGLSKELAPSGIRVNCVESGTVWTEFHQDPERPAKVAASIPWGRAGEPVEIAGAVAWLLSSEAGYATGATLRIAGGL